jgi:tetratricopeptide (TPR) repeat protein
MSFFDPFGTVPGSSLNWSQHALLAKRGRTTVVAAGPMIDTNRICQTIESVGQSVSEVVDAIDFLVSDLDLRLDEQTKLLSGQVDLLAEIAQTLRSPARTRAAERVRDAAELLRHHRNERALSVAEQAIDDDPNNDLAFVIAAWASLGVQDSRRALSYLREAAQATAETEGAEQRHMNAVYLAARLTFVLDGPEAALRELDAAHPFINPRLQKEQPGAGREDLCLSCLSPNKAGAIKFDRTVYYAASNHLDAALEIFRDIIEKHDATFCLMALTDPVLTSNDAVMTAAREALSIHHVLVEKIERSLPTADIRWLYLWSEIRAHEIENDQTIAAHDQLGEFLSPTSTRRKAVEGKLRKFPNNRWLEEAAILLDAFEDFDAKIAPLLERERMREAALEAGIQDVLRQGRKAHVIERLREHAIVGSRASIGGSSFQRIAVDHNGKVVIEKLKATDKLKRDYNRQEFGYS